MLLIKRTRLGFILAPPGLIFLMRPKSPLLYGISECLHRNRTAAVAGRACYNVYGYTQHGCRDR